MAKKTNLARTLRRKSTPAERLLWSRLRDRQPAGFKFRRQHCVENRIIDFFCIEAGLAIELDGGGHDLESARKRDQLRTVELRSSGICEVRFWNNEVGQNIDGVLEVILSELERSNSRDGGFRSPSP